MNRKFIIGIIIIIGIGIVSIILYENYQISSKNTSNLGSLIAQILKISKPGPRHLSINPSESVQIGASP